MRNYREMMARDIFTDPETKRLEEKLGRNIFDIPLAEVLSVDSNILEQKVAATVLQGAWDEASFWKDIVRIEPMGNTEKMELSIITMRDFQRRRGHVGGAGRVAGGGQYTRVALDVSKENTDYYLHVSFKKRDIELQKFGQIENGLRAAGARFAKDILDDIVNAYVNDATTTEALGGNDRFTALTNLEASLVNAGHMPDVCIVEAADFAQVLQTQVGTAGPMPFITAIQAGPSADGPSVGGLGKVGLVGNLFGTIPMYRVGNNTTLAGDIILVRKEAGKVFGLSKDITIVDFDDNIRSLEGFRIEARYDLKTGIAAAIGKVTGV